MNDADMNGKTSTTDTQSAANEGQGVYNPSAATWMSARHAAAKNLDASAAEDIGMTIGHLQMTANRWTATLTVNPSREEWVPGEVKIVEKAVMGPEQLRTLQAMIGAILATWEAAEAA